MRRHRALPAERRFGYAVRSRNVNHGWALLHQDFRLPDERVRLRAHADVLRAHLGLTATDDPREADVLLMNTCSVREKAQDKVYSLLGEWRELKSATPS